MNTSSHSREINISEEIITFEQKKAALLMAVKIAHAVEQLQAGLQDALILGKPTAEITGRAWETYQILAKQTKSHSDKKLKTVQEAQVAANSDLNAKKLGNFFQQLYTWLTTPLNVSWKVSINVPELFLSTNPFAVSNQWFAEIRMLIGVSCHAE